MIGADDLCLLAIGWFAGVFTVLCLQRRAERRRWRRERADIERAFRRHGIRIVDGVGR